MKTFRDMPIKGKLMTIILLTNYVTLILTCIAFAVNDLVTFRRGMVQDLAMTVRMIGENSSAALVFNDQEAAREALNSLGLRPHVTDAYIVEKAGGLFAEYHKAASAHRLPSDLPRTDGHYFRDGHVLLVRAVILDGEKVGTVYLRSDLQALNSRMKRYAGIATLILLTASCIAFVISSGLQQLISGPISHLTQTAIRISREKNYAVRAKKHGRDEIGVMIDEFNRMVSEIQDRDEKLWRHRERLEDLVALRTSELEKAVKDLNLEMDERSRAEQALIHAQKMDAIGRMAGGIAHDFNNLLQAIQGYADLILYRMEKDSPGYVGMQKILHSARRAGELTQQLLTFSRKIESKKRPMDINQEVTESVKLLDRTIPKMIRITLSLQKDIGAVNADPGQIGQVLMNLGLNARDAMPDGGELNIETIVVALDAEFCKKHPYARPGEYVLLTVSDSGCGMDEETLKHIFEPFFSTKAPGKGTGLGLAMVYGIVENHEGVITCASAAGRGTTFYIYLPLIDAPETSLPEELERTPAAGGGETILLVDDEDFIRDLGVEILSQFGYSALAAEDGESALAIFREKRREIDLVILDVLMPGMGGKKCLQELLKIDPGVRVIIASGYFVDDETRDVIQHSVKRFVTKPYTIEQLLEAVREALKHESA